MIRVRFAGSVPKQGQAVETNEDHFAVSLQTPDGIRAAVADGASSSLFSGEWATLLTTAFVREKQQTVDIPELEPLQRLWFEGINAKSLPWHQQVQIAKGAAAAFIGVSITNSGEWEAVSIGDCLLVIVRSDKSIFAFPAIQEEDLTALPMLLHSHPARMTGGEEYVQFQKGTLGVNDSLLLMTDALGVWFLREWKAGVSPWHWLQEIGEPRVFRERIRGLRLAGRLKDDDVTLVHIVRVEEEAIPCPHP